MRLVFLTRGYIGARLAAIVAGKGTRVLVPAGFTDFAIRTLAPVQGGAAGRCSGSATRACNSLLGFVTTTRFPALGCSKPALTGGLWHFWGFGFGRLLAAHRESARWSISLHYRIASL
jgi:hypothetical protein